jgi:hypothetical protein
MVLCDLRGTIQPYRTPGLHEIIIVRTPPLGHLTARTMQAIQMTNSRQCASRAGDRCARRGRHLKSDGRTCVGSLRVSPDPNGRVRLGPCGIQGAVWQVGAEGVLREETIPHRQLRDLAFPFVSFRMSLGKGEAARAIVIRSWQINPSSRRGIGIDHKRAIVNAIRLLVHEHKEVCRSGHLAPLQELPVIGLEPGAAVACFPVFPHGFLLVFAVL